MIQTKPSCRFAFKDSYLLFCCLLFLVVNICVVPVNSQEKAMSTKPPKARADNVVETIHGQKVEDPYRWLEDAESEETKKWVDEQNKHTRFILDNLPSRLKIGERLEELFSIGYIGSPQIHKDRYFYTKREGKQNQPVLYVREA